MAGLLTTGYSPPGMAGLRLVILWSQTGGFGGILLGDITFGAQLYCMNYPNFSDSLFLKTVNGDAVERPPVWIMRQAGRILPEYRELRQRFPDFKAFVKTPEAAAEATVQPLDALGVDAAIVFSDILTVPEAMGLDYTMVEKVGPRFPETITSHADVEKLRSGQEVIEALDYVYAAISASKKAIGDRVPLIGFAGAPWTIMAYMVEGGGSKTFSKPRRMLHAAPETARLLLDKITDTTIEYLRQQIAAGANLVQIFDSWAGEVEPEVYRELVVPCLQRICEALPDTPKTVFAKGAWFALEDLAELPCQVIGLDWTTPPAFARARTEGKVLQGNLDPTVLYADPELIREKTHEMIRQFGGNHIVNLGHGVYPDTPLEGVRAFVDAVKSYRY
jgi:uroporphyrinogen decarboxylase